MSLPRKKNFSQGLHGEGQAEHAVPERRGATW